MISRASKDRGHKRVVVDRCNITAKDRAEVLETMFKPDPKSVCAVYFDVDKETCARRVALRKDHETIMASTDYKSKLKIVNSFAKALEVPDAKREGFARVEVLQTEEDASALLQSWGVLL